MDRRYEINSIIDSFFSMSLQMTPAYSSWISSSSAPSKLTQIHIIQYRTHWAQLILHWSLLHRSASQACRKDATDRHYLSFSFLFRNRSVVFFGDTFILQRSILRYVSLSIETYRHPSISWAHRKTWNLRHHLSELNWKMNFTQSSCLKVFSLVVSEKILCFFSDDWNTDRDDQSSFLKIWVFATTFVHDGIWFFFPFSR